MPISEVQRLESAAEYTRNFKSTCHLPSIAIEGAVVNRRLWLNSGPGPQIKRRPIANSLDLCWRFVFNDAVDQITEDSNFKKVQKR